MFIAILVIKVKKWNDLEIHLGGEEENHQDLHLGMG